MIAIDGDQMIYASGFAAEGEPLSHALHLVKKRVEQIKADCDNSEYQLFIKGKGNFREEVPEYKGTRVGKKPSHFDDITRYMVEVLGAQKVDGMEADDKVSILLYQDYLENHGNPDLCQVIVSSPDKDLKNTPGWHYNPTTREKFWVSHLQATRHFCFQMLMGDTVDNIKGLPNLSDRTKEEFGIRTTGVGKATAKKLLSTVSTEFESLALVAYLYYCWGEGRQTPEVTHEYFQEQAMLLWMLRDYDEVFTTDMIGDEHDEGYRRFLKGSPFQEV